MTCRLTFQHLALCALVAILGLLLATGASAGEDRIYSDSELATMPAPGPNPYLSFLPADAEVDWNYWRQKAAFEARLRAEQLQQPLTSLINVGESEPNDSLATAQAIAGLGTGSGDDSEADVTGTLSGGDIDCFSIEMEVGDILGALVTGGASRIEIYETGGELQMGSAFEASFIYPATSPLPGGGNATGSYIAYNAGTQYVCVLSGSGSYTLQLRLFRSVFETGGGKQTLFIDFDGASINPIIFGGPDEIRVLSPLSDFLAGWGLAPADESALIDAILASIEENLVTDLSMASNPAFGVEILNSRDHADPFGDPDVSRLIVGGTIAELGVSTIGIAETIDPGNFGTEESAVILLDLLSAGAGDPNSLNQFGLGGGATIFDLVGTGVGNITAHEAGHYLGSFHTEQNDPGSDPSIMDQGGNLANTVGVGDDGIFGTADDFDTDFSADEFVSTEPFEGIEHTHEYTAFGLTGDTIFADGFESGDTSAWTLTVN